MKAIVTALSALALLACSPEAPAPVAEAPPAAVVAAPADTPPATLDVFTFACADGKAFVVTYDLAFTVATVKVGEAAYTLPAVISASGSRYSDGKVEFWEHQGEAMLSGFAGAPDKPCPLKDAAG